MTTRTREAIRAALAAVQCALREALADPADDEALLALIDVKAKLLRLALNGSHAIEAAAAVRAARGDG